MWPFIKKEFYHIFRDYRSMVILFGIPFVQVLLFGFAITNDLKNAPVAILDMSKDVVTRNITRKLVSSGYFLLEKNLQANDEIERVLKQGTIKMVVVFESGFARKLQKDGKAHIQLILDASEPNTASMIKAYAEGIINGYSFEMLAKKGNIPLQINVRSKMLYNPELKSVYMFVPGVITFILMLISVMMTSVSIAREKETGTLEALLVSPLKPAQIVVGKVIPYIILSFINLLTILGLAKFVFSMPVNGSYLLLLSESVLFIIMSLSLGILISTISKTQQQAMLTSMFGLLLPTILLSGFIFPVENMPVVLQYLSHLMPGKWFIIIIKNVMLKGVGIEYFWKETLIIFLISLFFIVVSIRKFKIRLE